MSILRRPPVLPVDAAAGAEIRRWALLAVAALGFGGLMALSLALGRTPGIQSLLPLGYFRMALVVHVVFTVVIWYLAMLGVMSVWARPMVAGAGVAPWAAALSFPLMAVPVLAGWGDPILNNYVPVGDHPLFFAGLILFLAAVAVPVARQLGGLSRGISAEAWGVAAAGATFLVALLCFALAWVALPPGLAPEPRFEALFWGGGHILQITNTALMLVAWQALGRHLSGQPPLPPRLFVGVAAALAVVALAGPALLVLTDPADALRTTGFTDLYRYGLAGPPALAVLVLGWALGRAVVAGAVPLRALAASPVGAGLVLSLLLFAIGGLMGYAMGPGDTRVTGHYHAVIGGVTLAFMVFLVEVVVPATGRAVRRSRAMLVFVWAYGLGQLLHACGLWLAGAAGGIARKTAGAEQGLSTPLEIGAMVVMGGGAVLAVIGGVTFVVVALRRLWAEPGGAASCSS